MSSTAYAPAFPKKVEHKRKIKPSSARQKGRRAEHKAAAILGSKRTPLSGAAGGGDVLREGLAALFSVEVKARPSFSVQKYLEQAASDIAQADPRKPLAVLVPDRHRPIVALYADDFVNLLNDQGPENAYRVRELARKAKKLLDEIEATAR